MRKINPLFIFLMAAIILMSSTFSLAKPPLKIATTTSLENSGLLDALLPAFEKRYNVLVQTLVVGTGQALRLAQDGNVDAILVHAKDLEEEFVAEGWGTARYEVMSNDFVLVGPQDDPAGIKGKRDITEALKRIAQKNATFISRGDSSGTHQKEIELWKTSGIKPAGDWYIESGNGMAATLWIANERQAYTLTDRATYLVHKYHKKNLDLVILSEGDEHLLNPYSVIPVSPQKHPNVNYDLAMRFVKYLRGSEAQETIRNFGLKEFGQPLFYIKE